jgi:hypothetical protein
VEGCEVEAAFAPKISVYVATISWSSAPDACRLERMLGAATTRIDASTDAIACPTSRTTRAAA